MKEEFGKLFDYVFALRQADPEGSFELVIARPHPTVNPIFRRLYCCFSELKKGFSNHCRPVLCLDGCFLKGPVKGELLSAVGMDGKNQMYPIAWAIVEGETTESWLWFLTLLSADL